MSRARVWLAALSLAGGLVASPTAVARSRDDTAALQAMLDRGGHVFLPKLPGGRCYRTRGLWVSRDDTTIDSDGACLVALGPGEARFATAAGKPVRANAVFTVNHSSIVAPLPVRVAIAGVRLEVPARVRMAGVSIAGNEVTLDRIVIGGAPRVDVVVGSGRTGSGGLTARTAVLDSVLSGGQSDVIAAYGVVGLRVEGNTLANAHGRQGRAAAAGLHIRAADRGQPTLDVTVAGNRIVRNDGPGIFVDLAPPTGAPVLADRIDISGNAIVGNAHRAPPSRRAGIVVAGGENDGKGRILVHDNSFAGNRGKTVERIATPMQRRVLSPPLGRPPVGSDDTQWLQARLDRAGGIVFIPRLPNGACYQTRGLWVSHDDTTITSDGACIASLGPGAVRLHSVDGDPIASDAVFFVSRDSPRRPAPVHVTIENLRIEVPSGQLMYGVAVFGHEVTLSHLDIGGFPKDDVQIGGRANGNGYAGLVSLHDSTLAGAGRNAVSASGVIGLRITDNTIEGVRDSPPGQPAAGIDVEPDDRSQPTLDVTIAANTIRDNAGPGVLLELEPNDGLATIATGLDLEGNTIVNNGLKATPPKRAGILVSGGEDGGSGTLALTGNIVHENAGGEIVMRRLALVVQSSGNDVGA